MKDEIQTDILSFSFLRGAPLAHVVSFANFGADRNLSAKRLFRWIAIILCTQVIDKAHHEYHRSGDDSPH